MSRYTNSFPLQLNNVIFTKNPEYLEDPPGVPLQIRDSYATGSDISGCSGPTCPFCWLDSDCPDGKICDQLPGKCIDKPPVSVPSTPMYIPIISGVIGGILLIILIVLLVIYFLRKKKINNSPD